MGILGGQFIGIRDLLPLGMERMYWRFFSSDQERRARIPLSELWDLPGIDLNLPDFMDDLTERDYAIGRSALAGGAAGFLSVYLQSNSKLMLFLIVLCMTFCSGRIYQTNEGQVNSFLLHRT